MSKMRGGFKGIFGGGGGGKKQADPKQFVYILVSLFVLGVLIFLASR